MRYAVVTFGCRVNHADSLAIEEALLARGAEPAGTAQAELVVVNTCSVTAAADQGARQTIRRIARGNPQARIVVTGCFATRAPRELEGLPNVVRVVSNLKKDTLVDDLPAEELTTAERFSDGDGPCGGRGPGLAGRTAFTLRVQTGCEQRCTYCIIPSTRGPGRSRPLDEVAREIHRAVAAGYREIVITGVHLGSYGRDGGAGSLARLVDMLATWPDDVVFRLGSIEPMDCTAEVIERATSSGRVAPHWHLPLQHGFDDVLRRMARPYTVAQYRQAVEHILALSPGAFIGADVVAGFPGETEAEFQASCAVIERLPLGALHVFPYSDRPGTVASTLPGKVPSALVRERALELRRIGEGKTRSFRAAQVGTQHRALVIDDGTRAVTGNHLTVRLSEPRVRNDWVHVRVEGAEALTGRVLDAGRPQRINVATC